MRLLLTLTVLMKACLMSFSVFGSNLNLQTEKCCLFFPIGVVTSFFLIFFFSSVSSSREETAGYFL